MVRLAYSEPRRCLALSHCYVVRRAQRLSSGYSFLRGSATHLPAWRACRRPHQAPSRTGMAVTGLPNYAWAHSGGASDDTARHVTSGMAVCGPRKPTATAAEDSQ